MTDYSEFVSCVSLFTASHFFSTAKKSNQKKPSLRRAPHKKHGVPIESEQTPCCEKTRLRKKDTQTQAVFTENPWRLLCLNGLADVK